ncbi:cell wall integrity and stress response component 4-like [Siniperca chuatsi]|uniref:cell wall integrity and stress response component 4-like n=1 Tax=Siniperca chuatsi TaxID=119488 RepID=UPI001CE0CEFF|nr:cell wall integrity and stress response component 4-like [Siniperca chuatsi]
MAPSQVSGMKMRNLLFGVILGLAVVHSTPVNTVTQIPAKADNDVLREAMTDGFLIEQAFLPSLTTESPKRNTTVQASQQPSSDSKKSDMFEGSADLDTSEKSTTFLFVQHYATTTQSVSHAQRITSTVLSRDTDDSSLDSSTTQSHPDILSTLGSDLGSGDGENLGQNPATSFSMTSSSNTDTSTTSSSSTATPHKFEESEKSEEVSPIFGMKSRLIDQPLNNEPEKEPVNTSSPQNNGHSTPGWIIIVGFIVGVAALAMLCAAIATRDKWNGPKQASQLETKTNSSNQKRELEMETFLHKDNPRENGKAAEYTVIPLDELSEKYSSK